LPKVINKLNYRLPIRRASKHKEAVEFIYYTFLFKKVKEIKMNKSTRNFLQNQFIGIERCSIVVKLIDQRFSGVSSRVFKILNSCKVSAFSHSFCIVFWNSIFYSQITNIYPAVTFQEIRSEKVIQINTEDGRYRLHWLA
jgi:hypothetical protein